MAIDAHLIMNVIVKCVWILIVVLLQLAKIDVMVHHVPPHLTVSHLIVSTICVVTITKLAFYVIITSAVVIMNVLLAIVLIIKYVETNSLLNVSKTLHNMHVLVIDVILILHVSKVVARAKDVAYLQVVLIDAREIFAY